MNRYRAAWMVLALGGLGCEDQLAPASNVDSLRVLAQQVDRPYAKPGETVQIRALSYDPAQRPVTWAWASCLNPSDSTLEGCVDQIAGLSDPSSAVFASGEAEDTASLTIPSNALSSLPESARRFASVGVVSVACPGKLSFAAGPGGLPFRCEEPNTGRELGLHEFIAGIKRIGVRESERNENPVISGVTFDGEDWAEDDVKDVGACERSDFDYDRCPDPTKHHVAAVLSAESYESGLDSLGRSFEEQIVIEHYATGGIFENDIRIGKSPSNGFVARQASSGEKVTLWFVAHDDRGGVSWTIRQVRVR